MKRFLTNKDIIISNKNIKINLLQKDIYHLEPLYKIKEERFERGLDFYVCVVTEGKHSFCFEGSRFVEKFLKKRSSFLNPLTKNLVHDFEVFKFKKCHDKPLLWSNKSKTLQPLSHLPIFISDHTKSNEERGRAYCFLGREYLSQTSVLLFKIGAFLGSLDALEALSKIDFKSAKVSFYLQLKSGQLNKTLNINVLKNCLLNTPKFQKCTKLISSLVYKAAIQGNQLSIGGLIDCYENSYGLIPKDLEKARMWREYIPEEWRDKDMADYVAYLAQDRKNFESMEELNLPEELIDPVLANYPLPDPDKLFPGLKEQIEEEFKDVYRSEWEETRFKKTSTADTMHLMKA